MKHFRSNGDGSALDDNYDQFQALLDQAASERQAGRPELAAVRAQMAGTFAWTNPTGEFASQALENLLLALANILPEGTSASTPRTDAREVLHVVTQAYQSGGSTQAVTSWVEQDRDRHHRVVLTRQGADPVPPKLIQALRSRDDLLRIDARQGGLLARASALRQIASSADVVVLHAHPYHVVPVIAFAGDVAHPPLISINHADHVFWAGTSVSQTLMNMRDSGQELAVARRGVARSRCHVMARPLRFRERTVSRAEAKRQLAIDPQTLVIATAADGTKYRSIGGLSFLDLLTPVVEQIPNVVLLAAGPRPDAEWQQAAARTAGRIRALGRLPDVAIVHQAADLYVDSFPFASLTSLLEAGAYGTPVATFRGHPASCAVLGADTRGVDEHMLGASDATAFQSMLGSVLTDPARREDLGRALETVIRATHTGPGWRTAVDELYAFAAAQPPLTSVSVPTRAPNELDLMIDLVMDRTGYRQGMDGALRSTIALLPLYERAAAWVRLTSRGNFPGWTRLLPEWSYPRLTALREKLSPSRQ